MNTMPDGFGRYFSRNSDWRNVELEVRVFQGEGT